MKKIIMIFICFVLSFQNTFAYSFEDFKIDLFWDKYLYNKSIDFYDSWDYEKSLDYLDKIDCKDLKNKDFCSKVDYNKWSNLFRIWESKEEIDEKISYYEKSIESYLESDLRKEDEKTLENISYTKKILDELKREKQEQEKQEQEKQKQDKTWDENKQKTWDEWDKNKSWDDWNDLSKNTIKNESMWLAWDPKDTSSLSDDEKKMIEKYMRWLKKDELRNQKYFNKRENKSWNDMDLFSPFSSDPFFDDSFDRSLEKDW